MAAKLKVVLTVQAKTPIPMTVEGHAMPAWQFLAEDEQGVGTGVRFQTVGDDHGLEIGSPVTVTVELA